MTCVLRCSRINELIFGITVFLRHPIFILKAEEKKNKYIACLLLKFGIPYQLPYGFFKEKNLVDFVNGKMIIFITKDMVENARQYRWQKAKVEIDTLTACLIHEKFYGVDKNITM